MTSLQHLAGHFNLVLTSRRHRGELLLEELQKPADKIDEDKALLLIDLGVDLSYRDWDTHGRIGLSVADVMVLQNLMSGGKTPADPACMLLAAGKGKLNIVKKLDEKKATHIFQWDRDNWETPQMAAAKAGHLDIIKYIEKRYQDIEYSSEGSAWEYSNKALIARRPDVNNKSVYDHAQENGHVHIVAYYQTKALEDSLADWRSGDAGYADHLKFYDKIAEREKEITLKIANKIAISKP